MKDHKWLLFSSLCSLVLLTGCGNNKIEEELSQLEAINYDIHAVPMQKIGSLSEGSLEVPEAWTFLYDAKYPERITYTNNQGSKIALDPPFSKERPETSSLEHYKQQLMNTLSQQNPVSLDHQEITILEQPAYKIVVQRESEIYELFYILESEHELHQITAEAPEDLLPSVQQWIETSYLLPVP